MDVTTNAAIAVTTAEDTGSFSPPPFQSNRWVYVGNLPHVNQEEIVKFLNLQDQLVSFNLRSDKNGNYCFISMDQSLVQGVLEKNGDEMYGRMIRVEIAESIPKGGEDLLKTPPHSICTTAPQTPRKDNTQSQTMFQDGEALELDNSETTQELFLRFRNHLKPWDVPTYPEVAYAGSSHFQQEGMVCRPIYLGGELIYKFVLRDPVPKSGHSLEFVTEGTSYNVPLYTWEPKKEQKKRDGTLITMRRAGEGALGSIPAKVLDEQIERLNLELLVPTKMQRIKDTQVYNGNRFCVVKTPQDLKQIPSSLTVRNPLSQKEFHIRITFKGQQVYCSRCDDTHVGQCPELKAFYEAKEKKEAMLENDEIITKLYSDSTMRHVETLGLTMDVCAMSGGGIGQVIQASLDDPNAIHHERIVIMGGTNDVKMQNFESTEVFATNIDYSLKKLADAAALAPSKSFTLVKQRPMNNTAEGNGDFDPTEDMIRQQYLHHRIHEVAQSASNIDCLDIEYEADPTGHPSDAGTVQILHQLAEKEITKPAPLIWNDKFIFNPKPYRGIESVYRYGCNGCGSYGTDLINTKHSNQLLCDECFDSAMLQASHPNVDLQRIAESVRTQRLSLQENAFPTVNGKRSRDDGGEKEGENEQPPKK